MNTPDKIIKEYPLPPKEDYLQACRCTKEHREGGCGSVRCWNPQISNIKRTAHWRWRNCLKNHSLTCLYLQGSLCSALSNSGSQTPQQYYLGLQSHTRIHSLITDLKLETFVLVGTSPTIVHCQTGVTLHRKRGELLVWYGSIYIM